ncbi:GntR family transcriptional regulator [Streptomyces sp. NPDC001868]|uniref:GntR family transcriptional regulator n=1 Tax=Streptomyces sp. NPDC001868 TaxID=3154401 RepID=UPI00333359E2
MRTPVVGLLRAAIVGAEFAPGERLVERALCDRFEVSRTVVREALRQPESEGPVDMVPHRGPVVATLSAEDAAALHEVREVLEALAGRSFAERATSAQRTTLKRRLKAVESALADGGLPGILAAKDAYYDALSDGAGNPVVRATLLGIHARTSLLRGVTLQSPGRGADTLRELQAITTAATARNPDATWAAREAHVRSAAGVAMGVAMDLLRSAADKAGTA